MSILEPILETSTDNVLEGVLEPFNYFIFTVKTDNAGTSLNDQFTVPTVLDGTYDAYVDWGDGSDIENITTYNDARWTHTFAGGAGTYTVKIYGVFKGIFFDKGGDKDKLLNISQWGIFEFSSNADSFEGCLNLTITATDAIKAPANGLRCFDSNSSLISIPSFTSWDFSDTDNLNGFFSSCSAFAQDLSVYRLSPSIAQVSTMLRSTAVDFSVGAWGWSNITSAIGFLQGVTLSTDNYNDSLIGINGDSLQSGVGIHFGNSKWGFGYGGQARYDIISTYSWTISDNGKEDSTLSVWLNAHNVLRTTSNPADGTAVSSWKDLSGNTLDGDATGPQMPTFKTNVANGEPGILFDGIENRLDIADTASIQDIFNSTTGGFCIAVFKAPTEGEVIGRIWSKNASDGSSIGNVLYLNDAGVTGKMDLFWQKDFSTNQGRWQAVDGIDKDQVMIVMYHYSGADVANDPTMYINSKTPFSLTESQAPIGTVKSDIGFPLNIGNANGTTRTFDGHIFELAFFKDKNPTTQEISDYFDYLSTKYGVTLV